MTGRDVTIVGGGVVGLSTALEVARRGASVRVVSPSPLAPNSGAATPAAGAMLGALGEVTEAQGSPEETEDLALRLQAAAVYPDYLAEIREHADVEVSAGSGTLVLAFTKRDLVNLESIRRAASEHQQPIEDVDHPRAMQAVHLPSEGWLDAEGLIAALEAAAVGSGVQLVRDRVTQLDRSSSDVRVRTHEGDMFASGKVVIAAGAWSSSLIPDLLPQPGRLPILPGKGVSMVVRRREDADRVVVRTPNRAFACGLHMVPRGGRNWYIGATNRASSELGQTGAVTLGEVHLLLEQAINEFDPALAGADLISTRYGNRPFTVDRRPVVGCLEDDRIVLASGTYRNGILLAPLMARWTADALDGTQQDDHPYRPDRPSLGRRAISAAAVIRAVPDLLESYLEPDGRLPYGHQDSVVGVLQALLARLLDGDGGWPLDVPLPASPEMVPEFVILLRGLVGGESDL